jgi:uncharacterized protein YdhG (YjbR/CyaY superfamily)
LRGNAARQAKVSIMHADQTTPTTIDAYIAGFPPNVQATLHQIRSIIRQAAPDAAETIKYRMPTFTLNGNLVHFAAFRHHIGLYPIPSGIEAFKDELAAYAGGKGSVRFPLDQPIPFDLIRSIVEFRVSENRAKAASRRKNT